MTTEPEHAFIVRWKLSDDSFGGPDERGNVYEIEDALSAAFQRGTFAVVDGHELGGGYGTIYVYGSDANALAARAVPILKRRHPRPGSYVVRRYGPPGADEMRESL
jgi:hypothetical protein